MFLIRLIRFLTGYVIFSGEKGFPERFLNLCSLNGINIWDAKAFDGKLEAKTSISCYKRIRLCAKKSGMRIRISKKCGLPFLIRPYLKRKGLAVGIAVSAVILVLLTSTVWTVSVSGNEKYTVEQILKLAESYGVYPGAFRYNINEKSIREDIKRRYDSISWFTVNTDGSAISIEVIESSGDKEILDLDTPCNIVSTVDGELTKLEVYTGEAAASVGSAVTRGDLLISGVIEKTDGVSSFVHARGKAVVRTKKEISVKTANAIECSRISSESNRYTVYIFGIKIPLGSIDNYDFLHTDSKMLMFNNTILPLGIITDRSVILSEENLQLNENQSSLLCAYSAFLSEKNIMKNSETEKKEVKVSKEQNCVSMNISYINHETSGIEYYFVVEDE